MGQIEKITSRAVRRDPERIARDRAVVESGLWSKLRAKVGQVSYVEDVLTAYYCAIDSQTPVQVKAMLLGALAYFVMPARGLPGLLSRMGGVNGSAVLATALTRVNEHVQPRHREQARHAMTRLRGESGEGTA